MNDISRCSSIIPVTFVPGAGGHFLSKFIMLAKFKSTSPICIDPIFGHAHAGYKAEGMLYVVLERLMHDPNIIINRLKTELINRGEESSTLPPPYYQPCHVYRVDFLGQHFEKVIRITYSNKDISDIVKIKIFKNNESEVTRAGLTSALHIYQKYFLDNKVDTADLLNISWDNLLYDNPRILIEKLSKFTGYPEEDFNISQLVRWREITKRVLSPINIG